ncbi:MAG: transcriptional activator NhaR [Sandaracinaceae bacterium]|nr:transcriptional activator NhaR [Sandaracinaceae bacterium]
MEWLNYHHLLYFYVVAREGSIAKACEVLRLTQPTISAQLKALEDALGEKLFERAGRGLALTETGHVVFAYAEEIFGLGKELQELLKGRPTGKALKLRVGVSDVVPKLIAYRLIEPALRVSGHVQLVCTEAHTERLVEQLSSHALDLVVTDSPVVHGARSKVFNHLLGECSVSFFARSSLASRMRGEFPGCLDGQPLLVPTENAVLRRQIDRWLDAEGVEPRIVGEFADSALMKVFGERGEGIFPGPSVIEKEIRDHYGVVVLGRASGLRERYYAVSAERRIKHPAVQAISEAAKATVFSE